MGKRGPLPTHTSILRLRGSARGKASSRHASPPSLSPAPLEPPDWLTGAAREAWAILAPQLAAVSLLSGLDTHVFARYCTLWHFWRTASTEYAQAEEARANYPREHEAPAVGDLKAVLQLHAALSTLESKLGLAPSDRLRLAPDMHPADTDPFATFVQKRA